MPHKRSVQISPCLLSLRLSRLYVDPPHLLSFVSNHPIRPSHLISFTSQHSSPCTSLPLPSTTHLSFCFSLTSLQFLPTALHLSDLQPPSLLPAARFFAPTFTNIPPTSPTSLILAPPRS